MKEDKLNAVVRFTKLEADALMSAASNMQDDLEDYYSFMGKKKLEKFIAAFHSGMQKLSDIKNKKPIKK